MLIARRKLVIGVVGLAAGGASFAAVAASCSDDEAPPPSEEGNVLGALAETVIVPTAQAFGTASASLAASLVAFNAGPTTATLVAARQAWRDARGAWMRSRAFAFGPTEEHDGNIDWTPTKPANIDMTIASKTSFTADDIAALGTSSKGFLALEYLLFDPMATDDAVLAKLTTAPDAAAKRSYIEALGADLSREAATLQTKWEAFGPEIASAGNGSNVYVHAQTAIDDIVGELVFQVDVTGNEGIAAPLGLKTGGTVQPDLEIARLSDNTLDDVTNALVGIENIWDGTFNGADDLGIDDLVRKKSASLADDVRAKIAAAKSAVQAVPPPMRTALTSATPSLQAAFDAIIALKKVLAADVVTALGVTLSVNDNDGD
ncbi:MAG: imelysin family protein [Polyangiaceae bacterium]|nr:imelysin family protein [Polyangiaceae bacterium]